MNPAPPAATDRPVSWSALLEPPHALAAGIVILGTLAPAFGAFVTATVLPSVVADIGGLSLYAWASTAYAVASILGSAGSAVLAGQHGTRRTLLSAAAVLVAGTAVCATALSMPVLVVGRAVQGVGVGMMTAAVHGVVREAFPQGLWPRMLTTISGVWGIAAVCGPAAGGLFVEIAWWRGAFWAIVPFAVAAAVMTRWMRPRSAAERSSPRAPADPAGSPSRRASIDRTRGARGRRARVPLGRLGLLCASVLSIASVANVDTTLARLGLVAGAIAAMTVVVRLDSAARDRLFPDGMLALRRPVGKGFWIIFFMAMSTTPGAVYIPLLLQLLHGTSAAGAGYFYAWQSLAWTVSALLSARLGDGHIRVALALGPVLTAVGFAGLFTTIASGPLLAIAGSVILVGAGVGVCWAHAGSMVLAAGRPGEEAVAASLIPTTQTFAVSLGAALSGIVANAAGLSRTAAPSAAAVAGAWLFGGFLLAPSLALLVALRLHPAERRTALAR